MPAIASYSSVAARRIRDAIGELGPGVVTERHRLPYGVFTDALPGDHLTFLKELRLFHRVDGTVFVHGGLDPGAGQVEQQDREDLLWGTDEFPAAHAGPDLVVYGHHSNAVINEDGWPEPRFSASTIGVDTISQGVLTAVMLPECRVIQSARYDA